MYRLSLDGGDRRLDRPDRLLKAGTKSEALRADTGKPHVFGHTTSVPVVLIHFTTRDLLATIGGSKRIQRRRPFPAPLGLF